MTVKDKVGRVRYVAFEVEGQPLARPALSGALPPAARLTRFDGRFGILRTGHRDQAGVVAVLKEPLRVGGREVRIKTLTASGTIRGAADALPRSSEASRRSPPRRD